MLFLRRREQPALTDAEIRRNLRPHGHVKGESQTVKADTALKDMSSGYAYWASQPSLLAQQIAASLRR